MPSKSSKILILGSYEPFDLKPILGNFPTAEGFIWAAFVPLPHFLKVFRLANRKNIRIT